MRQENAAKNLAEKDEQEAAAHEDNTPAAVMARAKEHFVANLKRSEDLEDNLQELVEFIQDQTNATGVYVGKLVHPSKEIDEEADDKAHLDDEAPKVVKFMHASKDHEFMVDVVLSQEDAPITHKVFKEGEDDGEAEPGSDAEADEEGKESSKDIIETFKHSYVKECVREKDMHFQKVPRLGCYMAVPLVYNSCLFNDALEEAVVDYQEITKEREEQDKLKADHEERMEALRQEKANNNEDFDEDEPEWKELSYAPFKTFKEEYVVCFDTLG